MANLRARVRSWLGRGAPVEAVVEIHDADLLLDALTVLDKVEVGVDIQFLDVRTPRECVASGVVEGAMLLPLQALDAEHRRVSPDRVTVVYCATGARSLEGARRLRQLGHPAAFTLDGGIGAWARAGGKVVPA